MIEEYLREDTGSMITKFSEDGTNLIFRTSSRFIYYFNGFFDYQYRNKNNGDKGLVEKPGEGPHLYRKQKKN